MNALASKNKAEMKPTSAQRSMFKTPEGQAQYLAAYDATLALWPVPVESFDVSTRFGDTHINACGPKSAPPLILLHAVGLSSTMWYPNVADLGRCYRLYALDTIGDAGRSVRTRSLLNRSDFVSWLSDVLNQLGLEKAHVAGMSYGGFLALNLALAAPERVTKIVLFAPAGSLLPMGAQLYVRVMMAGLLPLRALTVSLLRWTFAAPIVDGAPILEQFVMGKHFRGDLKVYPSVYTDDELRRIKAPTLLLFGEGEVIYDPRAALKRATNLIANVEAAIIPGAGHALTFDQPEIVNARVLEFLNK